MSKYTPGPWGVSNSSPLSFGKQRGNGTEPLGFVYGPSFPERSEVGLRALANARLISAAPDLLAEIEREYTELGDINNNWPGRHTTAGQMKLNRLLDLIVSATGRDREEAQDDYCTRKARAIAGATGEQA